MLLLGYAIYINFKARNEIKFQEKLKVIERHRYCTLLTWIGGQKHYLSETVLNKSPHTLDILNGKRRGDRSGGNRPGFWKLYVCCCLGMQYISTLKLGMK